MEDTERRAAAKAFAEYWKDRGDEKSDSQSFSAGTEIFGGTALFAASSLDHHLQF